MTNMQNNFCCVISDCNILLSYKVVCTGIETIKYEKGISKVSFQNKIDFFFAFLNIYYHTITFSPKFVQYT